MGVAIPLGVYLVSSSLVLVGPLLSVLVVSLKRDCGGGDERE